MIESPQGFPFTAQKSTVFALDLKYPRLTADQRAELATAKEKLLASD